MRIETVENLERLLALDVHWDELYRADPAAHVYLSSDFLIAAASRVSGKFRVLVAWSDDDRMVGLLPLLVTTRWSKPSRCLVNALDMLGHVFDADYTGILCDPALETPVCEALAMAVAAMPFERIMLNYFSSPPDRLTTFTNAFDAKTFGARANQHQINDGQTNNLICPYVDLPDSLEAYLSGLGSNTRQKLRRLLRQLDSDPQLHVRKSRPETYTQDVTILSRLWYLRHVASKGEKRAARLAELFRDVVMLGLASGTVYLAILWRDGAPVAAQANYIDHVRRHALFHVAGRDESVRDLSVGLMLQAHCIRWAIARGLKRYDFTIGNEPYKYNLGAVDRQIASAEVFTRSRTNVGERLDQSARDETVRWIRRLTTKGQEADARTAAAQAAATWPDLTLDDDLRHLGSSGPT